MFSPPGNSSQAKGARAPMEVAGGGRRIVGAGGRRYGSAGIPGEALTRRAEVNRQAKPDHHP